MKIIDILNKIANGEEPPKKIVFKNEVYEYHEYDGDYWNKDTSDAIFDYHEITDILNDEVEILEITIHNLEIKKNKIEKITGLIQIDNEYNGETDDYDIDRIDEYRIGRDDDRILKDLAYTILEIQRKINEIIDRLEE